MRHSAARQQVIARNVANADIPGAEARDLAAFDFARELDRARASHGGAAQDDPGDLARTEARHMAADGGEPGGFKADEAEASWDEQPRGGDIALEQQMLAMNETKLRHDAAAAYYRKAAEMMRTAASARI
jgi:flagellar basal-body rod protein FlgB